MHALQCFLCLPWHLRSKNLSSPVAGKAFLLEGKLLMLSLALLALLLAVTHSYSKRQQDQAAGGAKHREPRGWTDVPHKAEGGQAHT